VNELEPPPEAARTIPPRIRDSSPSGRQTAWIEECFRPLSRGSGVIEGTPMRIAASQVPHDPPDSNRHPGWADGRL